MSRITRILVVLGILLGFATPVLAQSAEFRINLNRDFGYGNGANIRGNFSMTIFGEEANIVAVTYYMDGNEMTRVTEAPYRLKFVTSDYPTGWHTITAVVETKDGRQVTTPEVKANFVSSEEQTASMQKIFIPLAIIVLLSLVGGVGAQMLAMRGNKLAPGTPRNYGMLGGTICPRCGRAYPRHIWGLNMVIGKLDRCDFCGKWAITQRRSPAELAAAEQAEMEALRAAESAPLGNGTSAADSKEERMRKLLDQSRYSDDK